MNKLLIRNFCTNLKNESTKPLIDNIYKNILKDNFKIVEIKDCKNNRGLFYNPTESPTQTLSVINPKTNKPNIIFKEEPFISYPSIIKSNENICNHCLKEIKKEEEEEGIKQECEECKVYKYCSIECKEKSSIEYHSVLCKSTGSGFNYLEKHASIEKRRFPLLAGKILARMIMGYHLEKSSKSTWLPLQMLSFAKKPPPLEWKDDYLIFSRSLLKGVNESMKKKFDYDWFVRVMQILYLNTIGIDIDPNQQSTKMSSPESGIGLYLLTSFINHDCDPNAFIHFPDDHTMHLSPLKPINPGDEITISYTDTTKDLVDRRSQLFENYGFNCECKKCLNDLLIKRNK
ncbi:hypothetical protein ACTFIY_006122 [Dictyostelium cf. discoideum]